MAEPQIRLLCKAFEIIELLSAAPDGLGVSEISRRLRLIKSGTFRILQTLLAQNLVYQHPQRRTYRLTCKFWLYGAAVQATLPLCRLAQIYLAPLAVRYGECCELTVYYPPYRDPLTAVAMYTGGVNSAVAGRAGLPGMIARPLHATAGGKCILAYSSDSEVQSLRDSELTAYTGRTLTSWPALTAELALIRRRGWAAADGEFFPAMAAWAVPVYDSMHALLGAAVITGAAARLAALPRAQVLADLKRGGRRIGRAC